MDTFDPWLRSISSCAPVAAMDADVLITIAFTIEALLFALVGGIVVVHEVHRARAQAAIQGSLTPGARRPRRADVRERRGEHY
jgi:hypothetical protein